MLLGFDHMAGQVFAYTEAEQFKTWTQTCKRNTDWSKIPADSSTIARCDKPNVATVSTKR